MKMQKRKRILLLLTSLIGFTACSSSPAEPDNSSKMTSEINTSRPATTEISESGEHTSSPSERTIEINHSDTEIEVVFQEYNNADTVEILQIAYDGSQPALEEYGGKNPEIEMINNMIAAEPLAIYQDYMNGQLDVQADSIEMRSYAFDDGEFLQIITTCVVFPETRPDLYSKVWSYNFSKSENEYLQLDDILAEYGLTREKAAENFNMLYTADADAPVSEIEISGFLINRVPAKPVTHFLLEVTLDYASDPGKAFFIYTPENDEIEAVDPLNMFDPIFYDMEEFDPPLLYSENSIYEEYQAQLMIDTSNLEILDEASYTIDGFVFVNLKSYDPFINEGAYTEETIKERIKFLQGEDIRFTTVTIADEHTSRLSYPVWLIVYETGSNMDTKECFDLYFQTDAGEYYVNITVPLDYSTEYHDRIGMILSSVSLV